MKLKRTTVEKLVLTDIPDLDPVSVFLEDYGPHRGKVTIECFGKAWSYFWTGMGDHSVGDFFCSCDNHYLSKKLAPGVDSTVLDDDGLIEHAKKHIIEQRREDYLSKDEARTLYDSTDNLFREDHEHMYEIYGDEWWDCGPRVPNYEWEYLGRILNAAKAGIELARNPIDVEEQCSKSQK